MFVAASALTPSPLRAQVADPQRTPNILLIVTDDQRADTMRVMPKTRRIFGRGGTRFSEAFTPTPLCCPSRATLFTGRYAHNHRVRTNEQARRMEPGTTFQYYLHENGYQTGIVGKYLNSWKLWRTPRDFDRWAYFSKGLGPGFDGYHGVPFNVDGKRIEVEDYSTRFIAERSLELLRDFDLSDERPWLLVVTPFAPHGPSVPQRKYRHARVGRWPGNPAVLERDRSDKPRFVRALRPGMTAHFDLRDGRAFRRSQLRTLMSVDDLVGRVFSQLRRLGESRETLAMFTSDNGIYWGEHGLSLKSLPYLPALKVPLYMRWPGRVDADRVDGRLVGLHDIAPSLLDAAEIEVDPEDEMDGKSLFSDSVRTNLLLEAWGEPLRKLPPWAALFSADDYQYIEYYDRYGRESFYEYYDLAADPWQLLNQADPLDPEQRALEALLMATRLCSGSACP